MFLCLTYMVFLCSIVVPELRGATIDLDTQDGAHQHKGSTDLESKITSWPEDVQLGCKELRAKRYISDGFCTSLKPIKEVVCAGHCMPLKEQNMPWWVEFTKYWAKPKFKEWRCVEAVIKLKKVQLMCENGETRTYKIKIVKSCKCKSYERKPNETNSPHRKRPKEGKNLSKKRKQRQRREKRKKRFRQNKNGRKRDRRRHKNREDKDLQEDLRRHSVIDNNESPAA